MKALDLSHEWHPNFIFVEPTAVRINHSVAWVVVCKHCHKQQLVGSSQARRRSHNRCVYCQIPAAAQPRKLPETEHYDNTI